MSDDPIGTIDLDDHPIVVALTRDTGGGYVVHLALGDAGYGTPAPPCEVRLGDRTLWSNQPLRLRCNHCNDTLKQDKGVLIDGTGGDVCGVRSAQTGGDDNLPHEATWTFCGYWGNDNRLHVEYALPGVQDDDRIDNGQHSGGLWASQASGATEAEAEAAAIAEYEHADCGEEGCEHDDADCPADPGKRHLEQERTTAQLARHLSDHHGVEISDSADWDALDTQHTHEHAEG